jgi:NAD(P)H-flavin reductase
MSCTCEKAGGGKNIFLPELAEVVSASMITSTEKHFTLRMKNGSAFDFEPGQIVEAGVFGYGEIPLGLASSPTRKGTFELVVRVVGKVSRALAGLNAGDTMTIRGPLGHGFPLAEFRGRDVLIVAGGIGLCPTRSIIRYILDRRSEFGKFTLFFGARSPKEMLFLDDLADWRCSSDVSYHETVDRPDDKWMGNVGVITTLFKKADPFSRDTRVIICGPPVMYKFVVRELDGAGISRSNIFVDLERRMKCGVGKCGHCQINDKYVCLDGPVFRFSDIQNLEEAI